MHKPKTRKENKYMHKKLTTTVLLAGTSVAAIHGINRVHTSLCTIKNLLNNSENYYYEWRFGKIRYQKKGSGSPLLFIHDLTVGSSNYEFHRLINNLTEKHEVYSLDLLGYGMSDKPAMTYTNNLYEQLITDFIKNVIGRKTSVVVTGESTESLSTKPNSFQTDKPVQAAHRITRDWNIYLSSILQSSEHRKSILSNLFLQP